MKKGEMEKENKKSLKCPECGKLMTLLETWDSLLRMANWYKYGCEYCGGIFEVKR